MTLQCRALAGSRLATVLRGLLVVPAAQCLAPFADAQPSLPDGFIIENVALGPFNSPPVGFAFLPDGRVLVVEKDTGDVHLAATNSTASVVIATIPNVTNELERGLLGVAVDPGWPARPYAYFHSNQAGDVIHVTMYLASGDLDDPTSTNLSLSNPYVLLDDIPDTASTHNGGTLRFGPDGNLYVSIGEDVIACQAQNLDSPRGKLLRLDVSAMPGPGSGPPPMADITPQGNPFPGGDWQQLVYAYGFRNPFRFTIDPQSGNVYLGDVGHLTWEEIDELVQDGYTGDNYGWPEFEGPLQDPLPQASDCSTPPYVDPIYIYPNPPGPGGVAAVVCGPLYRTDSLAPKPFPRAYDGDLFLADFYARWIRRLKRTANTWSLADSVAGQPSAMHWAADFGQISDLQQGPDGAIYFASFIPGPTGRGVHRIVNTLPSDAAEWAGPPALRVRSVPNPVAGRSGVSLHFRLARPDRVRVKIYDPAGRLVRTLSHAAAESGAVHWDRRLQDGTRASAGLYFYQFRTAAGERASGKIVFVHRGNP